MVATDEINIELKFMEAILTFVDSEHITGINAILDVQSTGRDCCI